VADFRELVEAQDKMVDQELVVHVQVECQLE